MRIDVACPVCVDLGRSALRNRVDTSESTEQNSDNSVDEDAVPLSRPAIESIFGITSVEVRDDGTYVCNCPQGHRFVVRLQEQLFEVLFELGVSAATDGYYREAVSSFAASLERFYEFSLRVFMRAQHVQTEKWDAVWARVRSQSERQLGAYVFLHMLSLQKPAKTLPDSQIKFRNEVVHKGHIPSLEKALDFGEIVREILNIGITDLRHHFEAEINFVVLLPRFLNVGAGSIPEGVTAGTVESFASFPTTVSLTRSESEENPNTPSLLEIVKERRLDRSKRPHAVLNG